ncbi:sensor histidine kinase [Paenibacillus sp. Marseille-Q4541]|uniref:cache domain-containing sensor histidine kinase n=1 Tax=Paenibacillus sp. Marseille-Q4541 TaxID=2831522 RepID=UPI001BA6C5B4|nr:sensor histidine kinase [Paenibacillus sp. Marseille-Q4541]
MNFLKKLSIRLQVQLIGLFLVTILPIIIFIVYNQMSTIVIKQNTQYNNEIASLLRERVSSKYSDITNLMAYVGYDNTIQDFLVEDDNYKTYQLSKKMNNLMSIIKNSNSDILNIIVVNRNNKYSYLKGDIGYIEGLKGRLGDGGNVNYVGFHKGTSLYPNDALLFGMNIFNIGDTTTFGEKIGYMIIALDVRAINKELLRYPLLADTGVYLMDHHDIVYSNSAPTAEMTTLLKGNLDSISDVGQVEPAEVLMDGHKYLIHAHQLPEIQGKIVTAVPVSALMKDVNKLKKAGIFLFIIALLLVSVPYSMMMMNILKPLGKLIHFMRQPKSGNIDILQSKINLEGYAEIEVISQEFNMMLERIHDLTYELVNTNTHLYEVELDKQRAMMAHLQSQVNPHFLYNTLDSIRGMALVVKNHEIYEMTSSLSTLLRYNIKGADEVTLEEELYIVNSYIKILQIRFSERFTYEIECTQELKNLKIPKMILQPIVENAIHHGIELLIEGGQLRIQVARNNEGYVEIIISDNGVGMDTDKLRELHERLESNEGNNEHIGVYNVHNRIKLSYGHPFGLSINSTLGLGTSVIITIPDGKLN